MSKTQSVIALLEQEKKDAETRIADLRKADPFSDPDYSNDNAAVDTDVREQENHQRITAEIETLEKRIQDIAEAMEQTKKGSYGVCKRCNQDIPEKRLELIPESVYCVSCESSLTK